MVSFRRKKKVAKEKGKLEAKQQQSKKEEKSSAPTKQRKKKPKAANSTPRSISKEYNSPLTTITETHDEEHVLVTPAAESSLLQTVNVVSSDSKSVNESTEVVFGSASSKMSLTTEDELTNVSLQHDTDVVKKTDDDTPNKMSSQHDDIRKTLFQEDQVDKRMSAEQVHLVTPPDRANEPPFDVQADYGGDEDPTIMDLIDEDEEKQQEDNQTSSAQNSITEQRKEVTTYIEDDAAVPQNMFRSDIRNASITKKLLAAFNCNMDTTQDIKAPSCKGMGAFYDTMCSDVRGKRPFYSEEFSRDFMEDAIKDGIPLMYHYEVEVDGDPEAPPEWRGHSVNMYVRQGCYQSSQILHPRLEWPTPEQQWTTERPGTVNLMDIQSIYDSSEDEVRDDFEHDTTEPMDLCFFSITTKTGQVHMFEAATPAERDWIVTGLKNIIVRLSYHLTVGDPAISEELFSGEYEYGSGDLPTLKTPVQAMNEIAHAFLD
jgi:hypothetical protein